MEKQEIDTKQRALKFTKTNSDFIVHLFINITTYKATGVVKVKVTGAPFMVTHSVKGSIFKLG